MPFLPAEEQLKILSRGLDHIYNKDELLKKLKENRPLKVKAGFDPSRPDLHLGHSLLINKLRQFQELGHDVIFIVGDFTACIGDPSGQNKTRPVLSFEESQKNALSYKEQATKENFKASVGERNTKVFEFFKRLDPKKTQMLYNSEWFDKVSLKNFILQITSQFNLARQLEREDFKKRFKEKKSISLHELFYPILQAYDSKELQADVELGGTDQLFNLLLGRELQEKEGQTPQVALTLPLLKGITRTRTKWKEIHDLKAYLVYRKIKDKGEDKETLCDDLAEDKDFKNHIPLSSIKLKIGNYKYLDTKKEGLPNYSKQSEEVYKNYKDRTIPEIEKAIKECEEPNWIIEGADKMSKSLDNAISFNEESKDMYGKVMSISDERLAEWWNLFTEGTEDITALFVDKKINPKEKKQELAWLLVCSFHGEERANKEEKIWNLKKHEKNLWALNKKEEESIQSLKKHEKKLWVLNHNQEYDLLKKEWHEKDQKDDFLLNIHNELKKITKKTEKIVELLKETELASSKSEARRKVQEGAVKIQYEEETEPQKVTDPDQEIPVYKDKRGKDFMLSLGKRKLKRINTKWYPVHDLKAYLVYRKMKDRGEDKEALCKDLDKDKDFKAYISVDSINLKIENYRYLDTKEKGLPNYSKQSEEIHKKYKDSEIQEIEQTIESLEQAT